MHLNTSPSPWDLNHGPQALAASVAPPGNSCAFNVIGCHA